MSKKRMHTPESEPEAGLELSPSGSWVSLLTLSVAGAGLPDALERLADKAGIEVCRYAGVAQVRTDDLDVLLGDRASAIREVLDDPSYLTEAAAAAAMGIGVECVIGLAQRRGVPTMGGTEVLVSKRLWENLKRILDAEGRFPIGDSDWIGGWLGPLNQVIKAATSGYIWVDTFDPDADLKAARAAQARRNERDPWEKPTIDREEFNRPGRAPRRMWDPDEELADRCKRLGIQCSKNPGVNHFMRGRIAVAGFDCYRLAGYEHAPYGSMAQYRQTEAYSRISASAYAGVFPNTGRDERAMIRAQLESRIRQSELASV